MRAKKIGLIERRLFTRLHVPLDVRFKIVDLWSKDQSPILEEIAPWEKEMWNHCIYQMK